jgi:CheY-like chemotaxis protein
MGYIVEAVSRTESAVDLMARGEHFDLLITDIVMPGMSGEELCKVLTRMQPDLRCIFMSAYAQENVSEEFVERGLPFIQKPFTPHQLSKVISRTLDPPP